MVVETIFYIIFCENHKLQKIKLVSALLIEKNAKGKNAMKW